MRKIIFIIFTLLLNYTAFCQTETVNRQQFFLDENVIETTVTTDIKQLRNNKKVPEWQSANIVMRFSDTAVISEEIRLQPRGQFRKANCDMASLLLDFKNTTSPKLSHLKKLKLVGGCHSSFKDEELLLKEYVIYRIYNFLTNMSFRTRLLHLTYKDSHSKMKPYTQYAFLIEDIKDLCTRNNCAEANKKISHAITNRQHTTLVCLFEYMIGNTDWSLPNFHNIKMIVPKTDTLAPCYLIPYDFDYTGFVNADYAVPQEEFGNTTMKERVYRVPDRTLDELLQTADIFKEKKERIMYYVNNFSLLNAATKKELINYLEQFYKDIDNKNSLRSIVKARKN